MMTLSELNSLTADEFAGALRGIYEHWKSVV